LKAALLKKDAVTKVYQQNKKKAEAESKSCHAKTMLSFEKQAYMKNTPHVPLRQIAEE
jgi:hypothetical protein